MAIEEWRSAKHHTGRAALVLPFDDLMALTLRALFRLALRQTDGLIGSIMHLLEQSLAVPATPPSADERRR